jgi:tetratricopeptide (TPR) repeat protein
MSVTVDDQPFAAESLGLRTVGQVLSHLRSKERLVVHLMIDGLEPDLSKMETLRSQTLAQKAVFIETIEPKRIAAEVFESVESLLGDAETLRAQAVTHLQAGEHADALKKLGTCFTTWNNTQESVEKIARLLSVDLEQIQLDEGSLQVWLGEFTTQLTDIRSALEARDYVALSDILAYEAHDTSGRWQQAIDAIRTAIK